MVFLYRICIFGGYYTEEKPLLEIRDQPFIFNSDHKQPNHLHWRKYKAEVYMNYSFLS